MADPARAARLAQRVKVLVAETIERRIKDPRVENLTVTDARVTNDLQHATVYYTVWGDDESKAEAAKGLEKAKGFLRTEVGKNLNIHLTPTLEFVPDEVPVNAEHLESLIRDAKARDAELAAQSEGAHYAGEENPYKEKRAETESE